MQSLHSTYYMTIICFTRMMIPFFTQTASKFKLKLIRKQVTFKGYICNRNRKSKLNNRIIRDLLFHNFTGIGHHRIGMRNIDSKCTYKTNPRCFISSESSYNANCCSPDQPCGIEQGGCEFDDDCFDNLECVKDNCGLNNNETSCCQAPGRRPGLVNKRPLSSNYILVIIAIEI